MLLNASALNVVPLNARRSGGSLGDVIRCVFEAAMTLSVSLEKYLSTAATLDVVCLFRPVHMSVTATLDAAVDVAHEVLRAVYLAARADWSAAVLALLHRTLLLAGSGTAVASVSITPVIARGMSATGYLDVSMNVTANKYSADEAPAERTFYSGVEAIRVFYMDGG